MLLAGAGVGSLVALEGQAEGVGGIEEQLLWRQREDDLGIAQVERDAADVHAPDLRDDLAHGVETFQPEGELKRHFLAGRSFGLFFLFR